MLIPQASAHATPEKYDIAGKRIYFIGSPAISADVYGYLERRNFDERARHGDGSFILKQYAGWKNVVEPFDRMHADAALKEIAEMTAHGEKPDAVVVYMPNIQYTQQPESINPALAHLLGELKKAGIKTCVADEVGPETLVHRALQNAGADSFLNNPKPYSRLWCNLLDFFKAREHARA